MARSSGHVAGRGCTRPALPGLPPQTLEALSCALGASLDPVFAADAAGRVAFLNQAGRARWGEVVGSDAAALLPAEAGARLRTLLAQVRSTREPARFEWGELSPAGVRSWFACSLSPLAHENEVVGCLAVSSDVTELKRSEERLRLSERLMVDVQGVAHLGTWEWDISEPNAAWSDELYRIYGLTRDGYVPSYEKYLTMVHPDDRQRVIDATNRVFHEHVPYSHDERIFRPDGSIRHLHTWAYPVLDETGRLTKLVGVCQDITDRKQAEEAVLELNHELERRVEERTRTIENSMRELEAFNSMVSHDLKAPVSGIMLQCDMLLRKEALSPKATEKLGRIRQSAARMSEMITDLLRLARLGQGELERSRVDLAALCTEISSALRRAEPEREVEVRIEPGLTCWADAGLIQAVMENLLGNAWKYSARVTPARIEVGRQQENGAEVFFVRDNGAGFDMKEAHRLFGAFQRLHDASEFSGTGVGLAAARRIIERHEGRIWAQAAPGEGATFFFTLPGER